VVLVIKDWRLDEDGTIHEASFGNLHDAAHAGRLGNVLTVQRRHFERIAVRAGERLRLRFVSAANSRVMRFDHRRPRSLAGGARRPAGGTDPARGAPLVHRALAARRPDRRPDGEPGSRAAIREVTDEPFAAAEIVYDGAPGPRAARGPPQLPDNPVPLPAGAARQDRRPRHDRRRHAPASGARLSAAPSSTGVRWRSTTAWCGPSTTFAGMPEAPLFTARRGEEVEIRMVNDTLWPHAIHLHGHHFVETARNGGPPEPGLRDTVLLERGEEVAVAFIADNPGRWMIHCHMLEHQHSGMETWFEVGG
jgi:FtsP/CotA-like multicopper oxidase with cupredoxin domain